MLDRLKLEARTSNPRPTLLLGFALSALLVHVPGTSEAAKPRQKPIPQTAVGRADSSPLFKTAAKRSPDALKEGDDIGAEVEGEELPEDATEGIETAIEEDVGVEFETGEPEDTGEITKDIVEEVETPTPEFPYPGATEEGFETASNNKIMLEASGPAPELIRPIRMSASGEYFYGFKSSDRSAAASMRLGYFGPPDIFNSQSNKFFEDIYGDANVPTLFGDYEWQLTKVFGTLGLKFGTGFFIAQGEGEFAVEDPERTGRTPDEKYTFLMMPNTLTAIYRFQYHEKQPIVPYVEGGAGYFTFLEIRDDGDSPKVGGAATLVGAGGINWLLDWVDPHSIRQLDSEWGINHVWLITELRLIQGLNEKYDFSSTVINAGVLMEF